MSKTWIYTVSVVLFSSSMMAQQSFRGTYKLSVRDPVKVERSGVTENMWTYKAVNKTGSTISEVNRSIPFDIAAPQPFVFENGRILLLHSYDAFAELYAGSGDLLKRIPLLPDPFPDYERVVRGAVHEFHAVIGLTTAGEGIRVVSIDADGTLSVRRMLEAMMVTGVAIGEERDQVAIGTMRWSDGSPMYETTFVTEQGDWKVPKGFTRASFDTLNSFMGLDDRGVFLIEMNARRMTWYDEIPAERMLLDAKNTGSSVTILTAQKPTWSNGGWRYTAPRVRTLNQEGKTVNETDVGQKNFSSGGLEIHQGKVVIRLDGSVIE